MGKLKKILHIVIEISICYYAIRQNVANSPCRTANKIPGASTSGDFYILSFAKYKRVSTLFSKSIQNPA